MTRFVSNWEGTVINLELLGYIFQQSDGTVVGFGMGVELELMPAGTTKEEWLRVLDSWGIR